MTTVRGRFFSWVMVKKVARVYAQAVPKLKSIIMKKTCAIFLVIKTTLAGGWLFMYSLAGNSV